MAIILNNGEWPNSRVFNILIDKPVSDVYKDFLTWGLHPDFIETLTAVVFDLTELRHLDPKTVVLLNVIRERVALKHKPLLFIAFNPAILTDLETSVGALPHEIFSAYFPAITRTKLLVQAAADPSPL